MDGGTAWMARESVVIDADTVDTSHIEEPWWDVAQQLKQDLASVILMSEADLQVTDQHQCSVSHNVSSYLEVKLD